MASGNALTWQDCPAGATFSRRSPRKSVDRYARRNENFVLVVDVSGGLEAYGQHELVQVINDALIETVEL